METNLYVCPKAPCTKNPECSHGKPHKNNGNCEANASDSCPECVPVGNSVIARAKKISASIHTTIKPYEKYIGLVVLAVVVDHFFLDSKFASRFSKLAEALVDRVTSTIDRVTNKLTDGIIKEVDEEDTTNE
jgi:hypothetical protein